MGDFKEDLSWHVNKLQDALCALAEALPDFNTYDTKDTSAFNSAIQGCGKARKHIQDAQEGEAALLRNVLNALNPALGFMDAFPTMKGGKDESVQPQYETCLWWLEKLNALGSHHGLGHINFKQMGNTTGRHYVHPLADGLEKLLKNFMGPDAAQVPEEYVGISEKCWDALHTFLKQPDPNTALQEKHECVKTIAKAIEGITAEAIQEKSEEYLKNASLYGGILEIVLGVRELLKKHSGGPEKDLSKLCSEMAGVPGLSGVINILEATKKPTDLPKQVQLQQGVERAIRNLYQNSDKIPGAEAEECLKQLKNIHKQLLTVPEFKK